MVSILRRLRLARPPKIGLALSGGGARGLAHIGVLKVIEREGLPIHALTGSSMGGGIAAAYAAGWSAEALEQEALKMTRLRELAKLVDLRPPRRGILAGNNVRTFLAHFVPPEITFKDLRYPLGLKAVDLLSGSEVDLLEGRVLDAVMATSAFPGVFPPVETGPWRLVDGGVLNNLPYDLAEALGAERILGVNVSPRPEDAGEPGHPESIARLPGLAQDAYRVIIIMTRALTQARLRESPPDLLLTPQIPGDVGIFTGFPRAREIIAAGEREAQARLETLRALMGR